MFCGIIFVWSITKPKHQMNRLFLIGLLSLVNTLAYGQDTQGVINGKYILKATLSDIVWAADGLLPLGLEYRVKDNIGVTAELGIPLFGAVKVLTPLYDKTIKFDMRYGLDARYYFFQGYQRHRISRKKPIYTEAHIGLNGSLRLQNFSQEDGGQYIERYGNKYTFNYADVSKQVYKTNIIVGTRAAISKHVILALQGGIGVKFVHVQRKNIPQLFRNTGTHFNYPVRGGEDSVGERDVFLNLPLAIRFCYVLY